MLDEGIVRFCAPVLTGIKTGGLFNTCDMEYEALCREVVEARARLARFGIDIRLFFTKGKMPLVYVYRVEALSRDLQNADTQAFLAPLGYSEFDVQSALNMLAKRLYHYDGFPHEIGLFLSYPLADVKDFVQFGSKCAKKQGYWCVFHDEEQAEKCFRAFDESHAFCMSRYREGQPLEALALAI